MKQSKPTPEVFVFAATEQATHLKPLRRVKKCHGQKMVVVSMLPADVVAAAVAAAAELLKQSNADKQLHMCCICTDNPIQVRLEPCGHRAFCWRCIERLEDSPSCHFRCPLCRSNIREVVDEVHDEVNDLVGFQPQNKRQRIAFAQTSARCAYWPPLLLPGGNRRL